MSVGIKTRITISLMWGFPQYSSAWMQNLKFLEDAIDERCTDILYADDSVLILVQLFKTSEDDVEMMC